MGQILVVDDHRGSSRLLQSLLRPEGHGLQAAADGAEALRVIRAAPPDLVLMDVMMPRMTGLEACAAIKADPRTRLIPVVLITALESSEDRVRGIDAGADDFLSKPVNRHELLARVRSLLRLKRYTDELENAESVILSLALTVEARDGTTDDHCRRLAYYATAVGRRLGLPDDDIAALQRGGYLHDVGKIGIPDRILLKPGRLTRREFNVMKQHTIIGERLCGNLRSLEPVRPIVRHHHERLDGSGYPDGLRGDAIPLLAQIVGIVDVFDALTTRRPYKRAQSREQAAAELLDGVRRGLFRPDLVRTFLETAESTRNRGAVSRKPGRVTKRPGAVRVSAASRGEARR